MRTEQTVRALARTASGWRVTLDGEAFDADAVVLATPAYVTATLLDGVDDQLARAHAQVAHVSTATTSLAYRRADLKQPLRGFGFIVPSAERRALLACTWSSHKFEGRAPEDVLLLRCFVGRARQEQALEQDDGGLVQLARSELKATAGIESKPVWSAVVRWPRGMPQYNLGHSERVEQIEQRVRQQAGLYLAGAAYHGVGIPDCIRSGNVAADKALGYLSDGL